MTNTAPRPLKRRLLVEAATGAVVLVVVVLVVVVHLYMVSLPHQLAQANPSPMSTLMPTQAPTNLLSWKTVAFPPDLVNVRDFVDLAVAPSDADTAYICNDQTTPSQIWVTHDRGLSWQLTSSLPTTQSGECYLVVATTQPNLVVATDEYRPAGDTDPMDVYSLDFASTDGGASWQDIGSNVGYGELATYQGMTYALAVDLRAPTMNQWHLVASSNLLSWREVDSAIVSFGGDHPTSPLPAPVPLAPSASHDEVNAFWLNPTNGELLAEGRNLWDSHDGGRNWSELPLNDVYGVYGQLVVQPPAAGQPWHLCDTQQTNANPSQSYNVLSCSSDGGQQWTSRQALNITIQTTVFQKSDGKLLHSSQISTLYLIGLEADGTLLAYVDDASTPTTPMAPGIYRLSPGTSVWQRIGRAPLTARAYLASFMRFTSGAIWLGGECASLVPTAPCYSVNASDGVYTTMYP